MPIYEFKFNNCGTVFKKGFHLGDDMSGVVCPICKSDQVHRVFTVPYIEFKGLYANDNPLKAHKDNVYGSLL
jgi:putative FmdB family regulatory protein